MVKTILICWATLKLPPLKRLRDGNFAPYQFWAVRHGPVVKFHPNFPAKVTELPAMTVQGKISLVLDRRLRYSIGKKQALTTICSDTYMPPAQLIDLSKIDGDLKRYVIHIYRDAKPPKNYDLKRLALIATKSKSTTRSIGYSEIEADEKYYCGYCTTPSGRHSTHFYLVTLPCKITYKHGSKTIISSTTTYE